jgi:hypothetical protein
MKYNLKNYINSLISDWGDDNHGLEKHTLMPSHISLMAQLLSGSTSGEEDPLVKKAREEFEQNLKEEDNQDIERQQQLYDQIAEDFSCELGKHESKKERIAKGCINQNNLTYGEILYKSIAECLCFIQNKYGAF